ncbi:glycosyltransferase family 4 protein [Rhodanobacter lindaniclasticus]
MLVFTSLYPNAVQPRHGVFIEERLRHLLESGRIEATVVAPVPWFPLRSPVFGAYARYAAVPAQEERHGIRIWHPRYPVIPKVGMRVAATLMSFALLPFLRNLQADGLDFDLVDAHYLYPDGVAAAKLAMALGKPVVISARGSDVNVIPRWRGPRRKIQRAAERAAAVVAVSQALKDKLTALGVRAGKITVLRNGVDLDRFAPLDRVAVRARLDLRGPVWLTVGNLVELKGVHLVVEALAAVPDVTLLIAGEGPEEPRLRALVARLGLGARVCFLGTIKHDDLCEYYNAADVMVLASSREGMPNVVLESMACGTPVVATPVGGTPELISAPECGELMREPSARAIVDAWGILCARRPDRQVIRKFAQTLGWPPVVDAQCALYARVLSQCGGSANTGSAA